MSGGLTIAVVGMAGRFPGAADLDQLWRNLSQGVDSIRTLTAEELAAAGVPAELLRRPNYVPARPVLDEVELFDAAFFGFSPHEAELLDPQHRVFLECAWRALEDAGYCAEHHGAVTGVYCGAGINGYLANLQGNLGVADSAARLQILLGNEKDYLPTRVSYKLGLEGPSVGVQTACSTSLVAVHLACQGLIGGDCDLAIAGGVMVRVPHRAGYLYGEGEIFSPDGRCRPFDAEARGTVFGSGAGAVVLRRLDEALAAGDRVRAVILGSAVNNDGARKVGFTAPRADTQARVIRAAHDAAGIDPGSIGYVEAHGTATPLGDPIEVAALTAAFGGSVPPGACALGSAKSNLGHLETAAGIAGLIKTVLALEHRQLPPSLHYHRPNPAIDFAASPFYVNAELRDWGGAGPRRAGVSSFGMGGTNAHVVLEEAPAAAPPGPGRPWQLLLLAARTETAREELGRQLADRLAGCGAAELPDLAFSLHAGRRAFSWRRVVVCADPAGGARALSAADPARVDSGCHETVARPLAFLLPGQGAQRLGMARELYDHEPCVREQIDLCAELLRPQLGRDLRHLLWPDPAERAAAAGELEETALTQPALFAVEYAVARLWQEWGFQPTALLGHSLGEYVAACLAGVLSLPDALRLVAERGRLIQELPAGAMASVPLPEAEARRQLLGALSIAAVNGPASTVVAGPPEEVAELVRRLGERGVEARQLAVRRAFHSSQMDPAVAPLARLLRKLTLRPPQVPMLSNVTGTWLRAEEAVDPDYWARHLRRTVRFGDGLRELFAEPTGILLEVGPGQTLAALARRHPERPPEQLVLASLPAHRHAAAPAAAATETPGPADELPHLLLTAGRLWLAGLPFAPEGFYRRQRRRRVAAPVHPFERRRHWIDAPAAPAALDRSSALAAATGQAGATAAVPGHSPGAAAAPGAAAEAAAGGRPDVAGWFYLPSWRRTAWPEAPTAAAGGSCLLLDDAGPLGAALARRLAAGGQEVVRVVPAGGFQQRAAGFGLRPAQPEDYDALAAALAAAGKLPARIFHLWSLAPVAAEHEEVDLAFFSLLHLVQALARTAPAGNLDLTVVGSGVHEVTGDEALAPEGATALGACRVIPREYEGWRCRHVDVAAGADAELTAERLAAEPPAGETAAAEEVVAYRGRHRWVQAFEPLRLAAGAPGEPAPPPATAALVTGGLGGVGLVLARELLRQGVRRLALLGRTRLPPREEWPGWLARHDARQPVARKLLAIQELEAAGAEVLALAADVADAAAVAAAVAAARARFGALDVVVHAAGSPGGGLAQQRTRAAAAAVLAPKVAGARALEQALAGAPPRLLVLCSSLLAVTGGVGQIDYCAANAFLDAFAPYYQARYGTAALAIAWDRWREVGMAAAAAAAVPRSAAPPAAAPEGPRLHPLLGRLVADGAAPAGPGAGVRIYESLLDPDRDWVLAEHQVLGRPVLPGAALVELVRAAGADALGTAELEIRHLGLLTPAAATAGQPLRLRTELRRAGDAFAFEVRSMAEDGGEWRGHAVGEVARRTGAPASRRPLAEIARRLGSELAASPPGGDAGAPRLVSWGPRWNALRRARWDGREGLAEIELAPELAADLDELVLHPALLDLATSFLRAAGGGHAYLPLSYGRVEVLAPLPRRLLSHGVLRADAATPGAPVLAIDLALLDEDGGELVRIEEFVLRRVDAGQHGPSAAAAQGRAGAEGAGDGTAGGIGNAEGAEAFRRAIARLPGSCLVISPRDLGALLRRAAAVEPAVEAAAAQLAAAGPLPDGARPRHPRPALATPYEAPRTPPEQALAALWCELLGLREVGVHDSFFELGGDSVLGIQLLARARQQGIELTSRQLFAHQTIAELAAAIAAPAPLAAPAAAEFPGLELSEEDLELLNVRFDRKG